MKNNFIFILIICLSMIGTLDAQNQNNGFALTGKYNLIDNLTPLDKITLFDKDNFSERTEGGEISIFKNINKFINVGIPFRMGKANVRESGIANDISGRLNVSVDLVGQIGYFAADYFITPYLTAGLGYQLETFSGENNHGAAFPVGLGLNIRLFRNTYLQAQSEYRFTTLENREQIVYGAGLMFAINGTSAEPELVDADGDGITDAMDDCPLLAGTMALKGCPDSDGDMVADKDDACPAEVGLAKFGGCPDTDDDGVMDKEDECPTEAGTIELKGCPEPVVLDGDNDGVPDGDDNCPAEAGPASNGGCPVPVVVDSDNDGIADGDDRCPNEVGPASNDGCPVPVVVDSDNDGVADGDDKCPNSPGTVANNGCPEISVEDKEILNLAVSNIEFNSARATLKITSNAILDQIVVLMNKYPDYNLSINGHTDSIGSSVTNQKLSENRAKSCYDYLVRKGISGTRMNYIGYGETQPIADNRFKDGRKKNRRVEFNLYVK